MITASQLNISCTVAPAKALLNSSLLVICPIDTIVFVTDVPMLAPITMGIDVCTVSTETIETEIKQQGPSSQRPLKYARISENYQTVVQLATEILNISYVK